MGLNDAVGGKVIAVGGLIHLIQILCWISFTVIILVTANTTLGDGGESPLGRLALLFYLILILDLGAFSLVGAGHLWVSRGTPEPDIRRLALMAGAVCLLWVTISLLWRFILPRLGAGTVTDMIGADTAELDNKLRNLEIIMRLTSLLYLVGSLLSLVVFILVRQCLRELASLHHWSFPGRSLMVLLSGVVLNLGANLIFILPNLSMLIGQPPTSNLNENVLYTGLFLKMFIVPFLLLPGAWAIVHSGLAMGKVDPRAQPSYTGTQGTRRTTSESLYISTAGAPRLGVAGGFAAPPPATHDGPAAPPGYGTPPTPPGYGGQQPPSDPGGGRSPPGHSGQGPPPGHAGQPDPYGSGPPSPGPGSARDSGSSPPPSQPPSPEEPVFPRAEAPPPTLTVECPGCGARMQVQKLGQAQDVKCRACGLEGQLEV